MDLKNQNLYPLTYVFNGYHIEIKSDLQPGNIGLDKNTVFINSQPLAVWQEGSAYRCIVTPYKTFPTLEETANAAVIALDGKELSPLQEDRLGRLPEGLPDLDNPGLPRVRKNILNMTQGERNLFIQAILTLKNKTNNITFNSPYDDFVKVHMDSMEYGHSHDQYWSAHQNALLPWHRLYIYHFESLLRAQPGFETVTVPYWNWTETAKEDILPFTEDFMGGAGDAEGWGDGLKTWVSKGEFAYNEGRGKWRTVTQPSFIGEPEPALARHPAENLFDKNLVEPHILEEIQTIEKFVINAPIGSGFSIQLNNKLHNQIHNEVGGDMATEASPNDPIFWLHHCMLDKVWADWQESHPNTPDYEVDNGDHPFFPDSPLQPWLDDIKRHITINDLLDYKRLYTYE
jgi:tyrosinase